MIDRIRQLFAGRYHEYTKQEIHAYAEKALELKRQQDYLKHRLELLDVELEATSFRDRSGPPHDERAPTHG